MALDVIVAHFGNEEDTLDRSLQSRWLAERIRSKPDTPTIFLGYLTTAPHDTNFKTILGGGFQDPAPHMKDRWCQYILVRNLEYENFVRHNRTRLSDTEVQTLDIRLPSPPPPAVRGSSDRSRSETLHRDTLDVTETQALGFVARVRQRLQPEVFAHFLKILTSYLELRTLAVDTSVTHEASSATPGPVSEEVVVRQLKKLLEGHGDLLHDLSTFVKDI